MKKIIMSLLFLIIILLTNFICNNNISNYLLAQTNILPLKIGNTWIGRVRITDTLGNILNTYYDTLKIVSDTMINGEQWYIDKSGETLFRDTTWGTLNRYSFNQNYIQRLLKYPANVGDYIEMDTMRIQNIYTGIMDTIKYGSQVISIDTSITVPVGTYSCYFYKPYAKKLNDSLFIDNYPIIANSCFSPGYGPIKMSGLLLSDSTGKTNFTWELIYIELQ